MLEEAAPRVLCEGESVTYTVPESVLRMPHDDKGMCKPVREIQVNLYFVEFFPMSQLVQCVGLSQINITQTHKGRFTASREVG